MIHRVPITKARINLGTLVKAVHLQNDYIILEKDGYPVAGIMDIDEFEDYLERDNKDTQKVIKKARKDFLKKEYEEIGKVLEDIRIP